MRVSGCLLKLYLSSKNPKNVLSNSDNLVLKSLAYALTSFSEIFVTSLSQKKKKNQKQHLKK